MSAKRISKWILAIQIILFFLGTIACFFSFVEVARQGGGFVPGFENTETLRLVAFLAPYLVLPLTAISAFVLRKKERFRLAIWVPIISIIVIFVAGQSFLKAVPDPIKENFGDRASPYPGFLILPPSEIPSGFKEVRHHYTKREYTISFIQMVNGKKINLDIAEGDFVNFSHNGETLVQEFLFQGVKGQVYFYHDKRTSEDSYSLNWLNPPKQRIAIYLTQTPDKSYSPRDLINILVEMRPAKKGEN